MTVSTLPLDAQSSGHPVHRATAMLRQALDSPPPPKPDPAELWDAPLFDLDPAPVELARGPVRVTTPNDSLVTLLGFAPFEYVPIECQSPVTDSTDGGPADEDGGEEMLDAAVQAQLQGLVQAFHQRQRQASLLVACSVAAAIFLTLVGLLLLFGTTSSGQATPEPPTPRHGTSAVPAAHSALPAPRPTPILVSDTTARAPSDGKVIMARPERPLALGPFLPLGVARYVLLRGLPEDSTLSAGRKTSLGTWMVKAEDVAELTLTPGGSASGDYPTEIYLLDSAHGPQARRHLILRVDASPQVYAAGLALGWPTVFPETPHAPAQAEAAQTAPQETIRTPVDGGILTARRLLIERAEHGQADAAYELALTYDVEVLARAGLDDIEGDMGTARAWYVRAAQAGHAGAARRLEVIAKRPAGA
jgi:hypothetical protein